MPGPRDLSKIKGKIQKIKKIQRSNVVHKKRFTTDVRKARDLATCLKFETGGHKEARAQNSNSLPRSKP